MAYSPQLAGADASIAYDGSHLDGPFENPGRYHRDNVNGNYTGRLTTTVLMVTIRRLWPVAIRFLISASPSASATALS
jgi:hypothetical protein